MPKIPHRLRSLLSGSSFGSHLLMTSGTNLLLAVLGLVTGSCAARLLGPEGRGALAAIQMWPAFLATIASLGLPHALIFFSAQSAEKAGRYLGSATVLSMLVCVPFMAVGYIMLPHVLSAQPPEVIRAARWYLLLLPVQALGSMPYHLLRGRSDFALWNTLRIAPGIGWLAILVGAFALGRSQPGLIASLYLIFLSLLIVPTFAVLRGRIAGPYRPATADWKPMLRYGVPSVMGGVPQLLNLRLDQLLMAAFLPTQTLGLYVVAVTWSSAVAQLPNALGTVLFPRTAAQTDERQRAQVFAQGSRLAVLTSLSVACAVALVTPLAIPLVFGSRFAAAVPAGLVLVAAAAVSAINSVLEEGLRGLGKPAVAFWAELAGLAVTATALLLLLVPFGILGAAVASLFGYSAVTATLVMFSRRLTGCSLATLFLPSPQDLRKIRERIPLPLGVVAKQVG